MLARKYQQGKVDILSLFGLSFLVLTLAVSTSIVANPNIRQIFSPSANGGRVRSCEDLGSPAARKACWKAEEQAEEAAKKAAVPVVTSQPDITLNQLLTGQTGTTSTSNSISNISLNQFLNGGGQSTQTTNTNNNSDITLNQLLTGQTGTTNNSGTNTTLNQDVTLNQALTGQTSTQTPTSTNTNIQTANPDITLNEAVGNTNNQSLFSTELSRQINAVLDNILQPAPATPVPLVNLSELQNPITPFSKPLNSDCNFNSDCGSGKCGTASVISTGKTCLPNTEPIGNGTENISCSAGTIKECFGPYCSCITPEKKTELDNLAIASSNILSPEFAATIPDSANTHIGVTNYAYCNGDYACNLRLTGFEHGLNLGTFSKFENYVDAYAPDKVDLGWETGGYENLKDCQHDLATKYGPQAAQSCGTYQPTKEQVVTSIDLGVTLTAESAAIVSGFNAISAAGAASLAPGATILSTAGTFVASGLTSLGSITTLTQTSNAAIAQIEDPGSQEAWKQTGLAILSWANLGTADYLISTFSNTASTVQAINIARNLNTGVSVINAGIDSLQAISVCGQDEVSTLDCGLAIGAVAADAGFGFLDFKQGQLSFSSNPLTQVQTNTVATDFSNIPSNPIGPKVDTGNEITLLQNNISNDLPPLTPATITSLDPASQINNPVALSAEEQILADLIARNDLGPNTPEVNIIDNNLSQNIRPETGSATFTDVTDDILGPIRVPVEGSANTSSQVRLDQDSFLADTGLPNPSLIASNPQEYINGLNDVVNKHGLNPLNLPGNPSTRDLENAAAEVVLGLTVKYDSTVPDDVLEYRVGLALTDLDDIASGSLPRLETDFDITNPENRFTPLDEGELANLRARMTELEEQLRIAKYIDPETNLLNKAGRDAGLEAILKSVGQNEKVTVVNLSIANLKNVNDTLGHDAGDKLIKEVADLLNSSVREADLVFSAAGGASTPLIIHTGGNKFGLVLPATDAVGTQILLNRIDENIQALKLERPGDPILRDLRFDSGIATWDGVQTYDTLLKEAGDQLTANKNARLAQELPNPTPNFLERFIRDDEGWLPWLRSSPSQTASNLASEILGPAEVPTKSGSALTNQVKADQAALLADTGLPNPKLITENPVLFKAQLEFVAEDNGLAPLRLPANPTAQELKEAAGIVEAEMIKRYESHTPQELIDYKVTLATTNLEGLPLGIIPALDPNIARITQFVSPEEEIALLRQIVTNLEDELKKAKYVDPLTGLLNKTGGDIGLEFVLSASRSTGAPVSIIGIDVSGLGKINEELGPIAGDRLIREAGDIFATARSSDLAFRVGEGADEVKVVHSHGDEFSLVLPGTDAAGAQTVLDRMRAELTARKAANPDDVVLQRLGFDAGVAQWDGVETSLDLVNRADAQMYLDKNARKAADKRAETFTNINRNIGTFMNGYSTTNRFPVTLQVGVTAGLTITTVAAFGLESIVENLFGVDLIDTRAILGYPPLIIQGTEANTNQFSTNNNEGLPVNRNGSQNNSPQTLPDQNKQNEINRSNDKPQFSTVSLNNSNFTYYNQTDSAWQDPNFNCAFSEAGCAITVDAMLLSTYAEDVNPIEVKNTWFSNPAYDCGSYYGPHALILESYGFEVQDVRIINIDQIKATASYENPIVVGVTLSGPGDPITHWTIVVGTNANNELVFEDPFFGSGVTLPVAYTITDQIMITPPTQ